MYILYHMSIKEIKNITKKVFSKNKIIKAKEFVENGLHPEEIKKLLKNEYIQKVGRGLYILANKKISSFYPFAVIALQVPKSVICLNSALLFHDIGTQIPHSTWFAIPNRNAHPRIAELSVRIFRFSKDAYSKGIEVHSIEGVDVKIYSIAKTIADCFKYRNVIGLDVALEALKDVVQNKKIKIDDLIYAAEICRVRKIMRPYIEALL